MAQNGSMEMLNASIEQMKAFSSYDDYSILLNVSASYLGRNVTWGWGISPPRRTSNVVVYVTGEEYAAFNTVACVNKEAYNREAALFRFFSS